MWEESLCAGGNQTGLDKYCQKALESVYGVDGDFFPRTHKVYGKEGL